MWLYLAMIPVILWALILAPLLSINKVKAAEQVEYEKQHPGIPLER